MVVKMADATPEEQRKALAEAFADGLDMFESRNAERKAKENAAKEGEEKDANPPKSFTERLLGGF